MRRANNTLAVRWLLVAALMALVCQNASAATVMKRAVGVKPGYYDIQLTYPQFSDATPLVRFANTMLALWARGELDRFTQENQRVLTGPNKPRAPYTYKAMPKVSSFAATRLISVVVDTYQYTGGAHGNPAYVVFTFGVIETKATRLALGDLFRPEAPYRRFVSDAVIKKLQRDERAAFVRNGQVKNLTPLQLERFVVDQDGLVFLIDPYEVAPYAAGRFQVKLSVAELGPGFRRTFVFGP
jgi:hypothetical protein